MHTHHAVANAYKKEYYLMCMKMNDADDDDTMTLSGRMLLEFH